MTRASVATFLTAALIVSGAQAMEIRQFDTMAQPDKSEFIAVLVQGAEKVLAEDGKSDQVIEVKRLFTTNAPDGDVSIGMQQFTTNLAVARLADAKRVEKDPYAARLEVEHAMILTLKENGIVLPKSFMTVGKDFKPKVQVKKK